MQYVSYRPRPPLNDFVDRFWLIESGQAPRLEKILPSGTIEFVVNLKNNEIHIRPQPPNNTVEERRRDPQRGLHRELQHWKQSIKVKVPALFLCFTSS